MRTNTRPIFSVVVCTVLTFSLLKNYLIAQEKHETQIFSKWIAWQQKYYDRNISDLKNNLDDIFLSTLKKRYESNILLLRPMASFLQIFSNNLIQKNGFTLASPLDDGIKNHLSFVYDSVENNMPAFIESLVNNDFCSSEMHQAEQQMHYDFIINKYKAFARMLFASEDTFIENENLLAFVNRIFEYCYSDQTYLHYQNILTTSDYYPVARFLNAIMWYHLVGDGWKHWHDNVIQELKKKALDGCSIVYIAGGTDIYQLFREGIYNITIIDPFLPTQARYYSEGWEFLLEGEGHTLGINDEIRFSPACDSIKMKRVGLDYGELFYSKMSNGNVITIKKSTTTWDIFDRFNNKVGQVVIHRRPVVQDDLIDSEKKCFLVSYDELTYLAIPDMLNGWGIDPSKFSSNFQIYTKQLRKPVGKNSMLSMRMTAMINLSDLRFINLGSDPT